MLRGRVGEQLAVADLVVLFGEILLCDDKGHMCHVRPDESAAVPQLRRSGDDEADLALVRNGYDLAMRLCPASFRGSGKPLLAHLVGTTSILADARRESSACVNCRTSWLTATAAAIA
jgi:hypothetical protein